MRERTDDAWFTNWRNAVDQVGQITLVCLPHAGAGASVYARWAALLPPPRGLTSSESPCPGASPGSASPR